MTEVWQLSPASGHHEFDLDPVMKEGEREKVKYLCLSIINTIVTAIPLFVFWYGTSF